MLASGLGIQEASMFEDIEWRMQEVEVRLARFYANTEREKEMIQRSY